MLVSMTMNPIRQRTRMHPELPSDIHNRTRPINHPPNSLLLELRRVLLTTHDHPFDQAPYPPCPGTSGHSTCVAAWLQNRIASQPGENYLVLDEAWRLLQHLSTARWLRAQVKLARSQRTSTIFVTQRLTDLHATGDQATEQVALAKGLIADTEIQILLGSAPQEAAALTDILRCGQATLHALHQLPPNHAIWLVGPTTTIVHHHLAPTETDLVNSDPPKAPAPSDNLAD